MSNYSKPISWATGYSTGYTKPIIYTKQGLMPAIMLSIPYTAPTTKWSKT